MTAPLGKTRTRAHVLADLSINYVERPVLLSGAAMQRVHRWRSASAFARCSGSSGEKTPRRHIFNEWGEPMSEPRFKFLRFASLAGRTRLRRSRRNADKPDIAFRHEPTDLLIVLSPYRNNAAVAPHHLVCVRTMLDGKALMDADEFDRLVGGLPAPHLASN